MGMKLGHLLVLLYVTANASSVLGSAESPWRLLQKPSAPDPIGPSQQPSILSDPVITPKQAPASTGRKMYGHIGDAPHKKASQSLAKAPQPHKAFGSSSIAIAPSVASFGTPAKKWFLDPAHSPTVSGGKIPHGPGRSHIRIPKPSYPIPPPTYSHGGPSSSSVHPLSPSSRSLDSGAPALSPKNHFDMYILPPAVSPLHSSLKKFKAPPPSLMLSLPPPPPNSDCTSVTCTEPLTYSPPGLPCGCVWPIQVKLRFSVPIYTFFTLVTELAKEIEASVSLNSSQVRIMGANAATQQLEKSIVLINLIPRGVKFNDTTALSIYTKFWGRQVLIKASLFGDYEVLYVRYPGLPPSPPSPLSIPNIIDRPYASSGSNGMMNKPLGVEVPGRKRDGLGRGMIVVIALSSFTALIMCIGIIWFFLLKSGIHANNKPEQVQHDAVSSTAKPTVNTETTIFGNMVTGSSVSFTAGALTYSGSAKTFSLSEIEEATNTFDASRILGEGGFGVVYSGILDDGKEVAVKVLKRYDQHGSREFLAEVEMLSRLHHRNLVQLIGICTEGNVRCLVYELIPNGSVESHLHGAHKDTDPLDWDARMKIALGAARGLAYLHEDSNPRVIHRDFKSSNILLEHDFTPKVSDFGLARAAIDEGNKHISTHVMGTFGYLAPEYAMTGHLLVKSDVYSYGVVLLELLTGRKPVDLSQPPGQENLVTYVRPLLTAKESLETIVDSEIKSTVSFDTLAKVAAIASMCVQPEVSHRPFMGEVVQALKLVCNEFDEAKIQDSSSRSLENLLIAEHGKKRTGCSDETTKVLQSDFPEPLATSDLLSTSMGLEDQEFGSIRRHSRSGPLRTGRRKQFWQRLRSLSSGSTSDHGLSLKLWPGTR